MKLSTVVSICWAGILLMGSGDSVWGQAQNGAAPTTAPVAVPGNATASPVLDAPIVRSQYALGPGDVVDVSVYGELNRLHTLTVTPEGTLVIPAMGVVSVLGLNLDDAEERVRSQVLRFYRNVEIALSLSRIRSFNVFLVGAVEEPGTRLASSVTRVSELVPNPGDTAVLRRNVILRRANGDTLRADLARFRQAGDLRANPTVREGDVVVIPAIDQVVRVHGRVKFPGTYEYRAGESLASFLEVANGLLDFPSDAADSIRITRFRQADEREFHVLSRAEALGAPGQAFALQPFDAVFIPGTANFREQKFATIEGQVLRPGTYPIRADTTTLRELVEMAGGFTAEASLVNATLRRSPAEDEHVAVRQLENIPREVLSREEQQILQIRAQGDPGHVVVDFVRLFASGENAYNQRLQDGDVLFVPRRRGEVIVLGAVPQPGIVAHAAAQRVDHFIGLAGGYGRQAHRGQVVVLNAQTGARTDARDVRVVEPGDLIIVPFRERMSWRERLQTVSFVATTLSSIVVSYIVITGQRN